MGAYVGKIALKDGKGTMSDFKYVDGASVLPGGNQQIFDDVGNLLGLLGDEGLQFRDLFWLDPAFGELLLFAPFDLLRIIRRGQNLLELFSTFTLFPGERQAALFYLAD